MKQFFVILFYLFSLSCSAQDPVDKSIVLDIAEGHTQEELFLVMKNWFITQAIESEHNIIQVELKEQGRFMAHLSEDFVISTKISSWTKNLRGIPIISKKTALINSLSGDNLTGRIHAALDIQVRNNKIKIRLYNFIHEANANTTGEEWSQGKIFSAVPSELNVLESKKYEMFLNYALPFLDQWWKMIVDSATEHLNNGDSTLLW